MTIKITANKLLKSANPRNAPNSCLKKMNEGGFEYITFENSFSGTRYIARKSFVEKLALDKKYIATEGEVVELGTNLTVDEVIFEMDANNVDELEIREGMYGKNTKISRSELNVLSEVLYNPSFDCSIFWANVK